MSDTKYRYMMCGTFTPETYEYIHQGTDRRFLSIEIPAPFTYDSEDEAMRDGEFSYRFVCVGEEVKIAVYSGEDFRVKEDGSDRYLEVWTKGRPFFFYNYEQFKSLGGMIYEMPCSMICSFEEGLSEEDMVSKLKEFANETKPKSWNAGDYESKLNSFAELFPSLTENDKPEYIDNEAYCIVEEKTAV